MIQGHFVASPTAPVPIVRASLFLPPFTTEWVSIDFLLDTGAANTSLHPLDAIFRVGIAASSLLHPQSWSNSVARGGIGGGATYFPHPARYAFHHDDGNWQYIDGEILIAQLTLGNTALPSLLGRDIMSRFAVSVDWQASTVTLA